jgi:1-acyl-sn-glycerol-3-phosphate acyltransferase
MPAMPQPAADDPQPAIPARHIPLAQELLWRAIILPSLWSTFSAARAFVEGRLPRPADGPLIVYLTHNAWWDAYMLFLIRYAVLGGGWQHYAMMEEKQLRSFRFFAWCGAFSIDPADPGDARRSLAYISRRLRERRDRCLWIFPQGRIVPADRRPLVVYPGLARIVRQTGGATLCPVALRYEFRGEQRPEVFIRIGPAHRASGDTKTAALTADIRARLTCAADALREEVLHERLERYQEIMRGRPGIDRVTEALLRLLPRRAPRAR